MFSLLSGLWQHAFQKQEYYVLILGLDNAGKTVRGRCRLLNLAVANRSHTQTLLEKFKAINNTAYHGMPLEKITPTVGLNGAPRTSKTIC